MSIVVWEWQNEANIYLPYSSEVSTALENARINNIKQLDLGGVDPYMSTFLVNIPMMTQITNYNGKRRVVRRVNINSTHPFARGLKWEWNFHQDHWFPYSTAVCEAIQQAVETNTPVISNVLPGYEINVSNLTQTNTRTNFQRRIRKVHCTKYRAAQQTSNSFVSSSIQPMSTPVPPVQQMRPPPIQQMRPPPIQQMRQQPPVQQMRQQPPAANFNVSSTNIAASRQPPAQPAVQPSGSRRPPSNKQKAKTTRSSSASSSSSPQNGPLPLPAPLQSIIQSSCSSYVRKPGSSDNCPVCQNNMTQPSDYTTPAHLIGVNFDALTLKCAHHIHAQCLHALIAAGKQFTSFSCPECQHSFGKRTGNQPASGKMAVKVDNSISLAGYEQYGTIIVTYTFSSGVQDGVAYSANGFPRTAYFPDTDRGNDIVDLIKEAFKRRLIFTIGDSVTTGQKNCIVWNDIHHKTSMRHGDTYGYPDPTYLDRVAAELKSKGVE